MQCAHSMNRFISPILWFSCCQNGVCPSRENRDVCCPSSYAFSLCSANARESYSDSRTPSCQIIPHKSRKVRTPSSRLGRGVVNVLLRSTRQRARLRWSLISALNIPLVTTECLSLSSTAVKCTHEFIQERWCHEQDSSFMRPYGCFSDVAFHGSSGPGAGAEVGSHAHVY